MYFTCKFKVVHDSKSAEMGMEILYGLCVSKYVLLFSCGRKPLNLYGASEDCTSLQLKVFSSLSFFSFFFLAAEHFFSLSAVLQHPDPEDSVTTSYGRFISDVKPEHLSSVVLQRSKRMILDSIGVGLIGSTTDVFELALQHCQVRLRRVTYFPQGFYWT